MKPIRKSNKLENVFYDIRGPVLAAAKELETKGHRILKLNIGNPAPFGFEAPEEIIQDVIYNLSAAQGYTDSKGLFSARKAIMQYYQQKGVNDVGIDDIFLGNGASELIVMSLQGLLNIDDEVLVPAPDYPLWTGATHLASGQPIHYRCDEENDWQPDLEDIKQKITPKTRAIVVINPNNPTGAVYSKATLQAIVDIANEHKLVILADEIYDKILFEDTPHYPLSSFHLEKLCITFNGLSKAYRLAGFRSGWMMLNGERAHAEDYIEGLNMLASMRLCANAPAQQAIQTALGGYQSIGDLVAPGGRIREQRDCAWAALNDIPGVSCTKPGGALYLFPKIDRNMYKFGTDEDLVLEFLQQHRVLLVHGSAFNCSDQDHLRVVFLPDEKTLADAVGRFGEFLQQFR